MSERSVSRALLRFGALTTAVVLAFGGTSAAAFAQDDPTSTSPVPTETSTPQPPSSEPAPPSSTEPAPPSTSDPVPPSSTPTSEPTTQPPAPTTPAETPNVPAPQTPTEQKSEQKTEQKSTAAELPDLKITASIDKTHYLSHEPVRLKVTITNQSSFAAERVRASAWGIQTPLEDWGDFFRGTTLAPGESRVVEVSGTVASLNGDKLDLGGYAQAEGGDANHNDNYFHLSATVTQTVGNAGGLVYADANRNGQPDAGEPISGALVSIYGGSPSGERRTTTDANGRFAFTGVPSGKYSPYFELSGGWTVHAVPGQEYFTIAPDQTVELSGRAERPFSEVLTATASLDRDHYAFPAKAKVRLTLANTGDRPMSGIQAGCNRGGFSNRLGDGAEWGPLRWDGAGVTLAAGEKRTFTIVEDVPEGAAQAGTLLLSCDFAPSPGWNTDGPYVSDRAEVTGGKGRYTMWLADDKNENHTRDQGEEIAGLKIILIRQDTGDQVAEAVSNSEGTLEFVDVPVGTYQAVILGPWSFRYGPDADVVQVVGWGSTAFVGLKADAAPADLRAVVKFDKARYESHETVRMSLTVTNIGGRLAERVRLVSSPNALDVPDEQWGDFRPGGRGVQIPAGESRTFEASGTIRDFSNGKLTVWGVVDYLGRPNPTNSDYHGEFEVVQTKDDISGVAYTDKNRNGQQDAGEAAAGVLVEANGGAPSRYFKTTTDADGRYSFKDVPSGDYYVGYTFADGWIVRQDTQNPKVRVQPGVPLQLIGRGERPYHELLSAKMELDQDVYEVGEDAKITITLTNSSDREISGITAACNFAGNENQLGGRIGDPHPKGWGELLSPGKGVTVGAGETKTFVAIEKVPDAAFTYGSVGVGCMFAPHAGLNMDGASAGDSARVPGGFGSVTGELYYDRNGNYEVDAGEAIGNTRIVLRDRELGEDVAETFSDDRGNVHFDKVPAGDLWAWVDGPWKFKGESDGHVGVMAGSESRTGFPVVPDLKPETGEGGNTPPAPGPAAGGSGDALAKTGASVLGLGLIGALLVAFGFGASIVGRRRTA